MIQTKRAKGICVVNQEVYHAPRRHFVRADYLDVHQYDSRRNINENRKHHRSLRTLENENPNKNKKITRNQSQKALLTHHNPESTEFSSTHNKQLKSVFHRNQTEERQRYRNDNLEEYLKRKAPKVVSNIRTNICVNLAMRRHVVIWLAELFHGARLKSESLFHCVCLFDNIVGENSVIMNEMAVNVENLQLLALACFFISTKYEEIYPPTAKKCVEIADFTFSKTKILQMQSKILAAHQFSLTFPTRFTFLQHYLPQNINDLPANKYKRLYHLTLYLLEISLLTVWEDATEDELSKAAVLVAQKVIQVQTETGNRKIYQLGFKLLQLWKQNKGSVISLIFDTDRYSFVGGLYIDGI